MKDHAKGSKELYQRVYEEHDWYGNGDIDRCPGVRLIPQYKHWLKSPLMDLGCGRGHTVERLREAGFEAEGIDQVEIHPGMRVADITQPVEDLDRFNSVICIDCIEHLHDEQLAGLFENMKKVPYQAFSVHNGESNGTGEELHVNRKPFAQWRKIIKGHFDIEEEIEVTHEQLLYLTSRKATVLARNSG